VRVEDLVQVGLLLFDQLLQLGDLADLLERKDLVLLVTIHRQTGGVVATVLKPGEAIDEGIEDILPILLDEVVDVAKNATASKRLADNSPGATARSARSVDGR
jgi:hypothetical protein